MDNTTVAAKARPFRGKYPNLLIRRSQIFKWNSSRNSCPMNGSFGDAMLWIRWRLTGCLFLWFVLPKNISVYLSKLTVPGARSLAFLSVGHCIILLPLLALVGNGIRYAYFQPSPNMSGHVAWYSIVATVLLANKSSSALSILLGQSWERLVPYHHLAAYIAIINSLLHGFICFSCDGVHDADDVVPQPNNTSSYGATNLDLDNEHEHDDVSEHSRYGENPDLQSYLVDGNVNISGTLMTVCLICLVLTSSVRWFREKRFDAWLVLHIFFSLGIASSSFVHAMTEAKLIFLWWLADVFIRHVVNPNCCSPNTAVLTRLLPDLVEVRFRRCIRYRSGQFVRIAVHDIGRHEFHPVTISSACHESDMTVHFRVRGDWTKRLAEAAKRCPKVAVSIQGPFGSLSMPLLDDNTRYPHVLLICGGIGVTPMISLARDLVYRHNKCGKRRCKIHFVWVVQTPAIVDALSILQVNKANKMFDETEEMCTGNDSDHSDEEMFTDFDHVQSDEEMFTDFDHEESDEEVFTDFDYEQSSDEMVDTSNDSVATKNGSVFHSDVYITKSTMLPNVVSANTNYHHGRPDISKIIAVTKSNIENMQQAAFVRCTSRVAVVACGPAKLVESAKIECRKQSCSNVVFDFHDEVFDY